MSIRYLIDKDNDMQKETNSIKPTLKFSSPLAQEIYEELASVTDEEGKRKYGPQINKKQYAEINVGSVSAIDHCIKHGYGIAPYRKLGPQKNAKVLFSLRAVAEYLAAQTVQTA